MADLLGVLAARVLGELDSVRPRLPGRFEPAGGGDPSGPDEAGLREHDDLVDVGGRPGTASAEAGAAAEPSRRRAAPPASVPAPDEPALTDTRNADDVADAPVPAPPREAPVRPHGGEQPARHAVADTPPRRPSTRARPEAISAGERSRPPGGGRVPTPVGPPDAALDERVPAAPRPAEPRPPAAVEAPGHARPDTPAPEGDAPAREAPSGPDVRMAPRPDAAPGDVAPSEGTADVPASITVSIGTVEVRALPPPAPVTPPRRPERPPPRLTLGEHLARHRGGRR